MSAKDGRLAELGLITPQLAQAQAIENLSNPKGVANRTLSVLTIKDLPRINLLMALYDVTGYDWVKNSYENELHARSSLNRKGVRGRDDLVAICKSQDEQKGALDSFKEKITSFFRSGQ